MTSAVDGSGAGAKRSNPAVMIAVDGTSGSGKSSTCREVALRLGGRYIDTGAMYRAITWWMLQQGVDPQDSAAIIAAIEAVQDEHGSRVQPRLETDPSNPRVWMGNTDVTDEIRSSAVSSAVSAVSAVPEVRNLLIDTQRRLAESALAQGLCVVMEGRDIGSFVMPNADLKIFLTADEQVRAQRRLAEDTARGTVIADDQDADAEATTRAHLAERDHRDSSRKASPLTLASDAITIDGTRLSLPEVVDLILQQLASDRP